MTRSMRRVTVGGLALVGLVTGGSLTAAALAIPASAKPITPATCAHLNAPAPKHNVAKPVALTGCSLVKATGGRGRFGALITAPGSAHATIRWNKAGSTTSFDYKLFPDTTPDESEAQDCPAHTKEFVVFGQVSGGTGAAARLIPNGQPISAEVCVSSARVINEPGTKVTI